MPKHINWTKHLAGRAADDLRQKLHRRISQRKTPEENFTPFTVVEHAETATSRRSCVYGGFQAKNLNLDTYDA